LFYLIFAFSEIKQSTIDQVKEFQEQLQRAKEGDLSLIDGVNEAQIVRRRIRECLIHDLENSRGNIIIIQSAGDKRNLCKTTI
jgi:hypothetical protein